MKSNGTAPLAYSYLRFSSPEQAKGDSLRRQTELRDGWLSRNGIVLDTSVTLRDEGISGFSGKHRENPDRHALAAFLRLVQAGRIARGSYLVVESLDRLTREHIRPALTLLLNLIEHGIRIVQLLPAETIYDENVEPMTLMMAIMELSRGHSESRMKSERGGRAWKAKRDRAATSGEALTRKVPSWLRVEDGKFVVHERSADAVRRIYRLAIDGYGIGALVRKLNAERVPSIGRARYWARSYVAKILDNRAVLGEYQPHTSAGGKKRAPVGPPIPGYYPVIITEADWFAAHAALRDRRTKAGRTMKTGVNVFASLLRDARDGGSIIMMDKSSRKKGGGKILGSYLAAQGTVGSQFVSFPFQAFVESILGQLREVKPDDILPPDDTAGDAILALTGRLVSIDSRLTKIQAALLERDDIEALAGAAATLEAEQREVQCALDAARQTAATPLTGAWSTCHSLIDLHRRGDADHDVLIRLRSAIRRVVQAIWCLFIARGRRRIALVQVWFHGQAIHRDYLIVHMPKRGSAHWRAAAVTTVQSMRYEGPVDLRERESVAVVEQFLDGILGDAAEKPCRVNGQRSP